MIIFRKDACDDACNGSVSFFFEHASYDAFQDAWLKTRCVGGENT